MRAFSFGGGVQSTAVLVLTAQGILHYDAFLFANVGDDSENPDTLTYISQHAKPFAAHYGINLVEVRRRLRSGSEAETLLQWTTNPTSRTIGIPVRMANGAPGNRTCTETYKIRVVARWLREHGATPQNPATLGMGISMDEFWRMRNASGYKHYGLEYPLIDRSLSREACREIITAAGLPIPPKSSCWFCPFHKLAEWQAMEREHPERFDRAAALEQQLTIKRASLSRDAIYFTSKGKPLREAIHSSDGREVDDATCDSGFCFM